MPGRPRMIRQFDPNLKMKSSTNTSGDITNPVAGEPFLSSWTWDSGIGKLTAEITTPQGVVVIVNSSAPTLKGQTVSQVILDNLTSTRQSTLALDRYEFTIKIIMNDGTQYSTKGSAQVSDVEKKKMIDNPDYITKPIYRKPIDRSKYIKWMCYHMVSDETIKVCDECKCKYNK